MADIDLITNMPREYEPMIAIIGPAGDREYRAWWRSDQGALTLSSHGHVRSVTIKSTPTGFDLDARGFTTIPMDGWTPEHTREYVADLLRATGENSTPHQPFHTYLLNSTSQAALMGSLGALTVAPLFLVLCFVVDRPGALRAEHGFRLFPTATFTEYDTVIARGTVMECVYKQANSRAWVRMVLASVRAKRRHTLWLYRFASVPWLVGCLIMLPAGRWPIATALSGLPMLATTAAMAAEQWTLHRPVLAELRKRREDVEDERMRLWIYDAMAATVLLGALVSETCCMLYWWLS